MTGRLARGVMWDVKTAGYLKKRPDRPFAVFLDGWAALMWGDAGKAERCFNEVIAKNADYAPAYMGLIGLEILLGRMNKAALSLNKYSAKIALAKKINRFRLCCVISACAIKRFKETPGKPAENRGPILSIKFFVIDRAMKKQFARIPPYDAKEIIYFHKLIRYIELAQRRATPVPAGNTPLRGAVAPINGKSLSRALKKDDKERIKLAGEIYTAPGLMDEFRLYILNDAGLEAGEFDFTFDSPAIFTKTLINRLFREKILIGELREPRIILSNLRRDINARGIDNVNKWLFLKLCHAARRSGELEIATARELESDGWWADPIVRGFLRG